MEKLGERGVGRNGGRDRKREGDRRWRDWGNEERERERERKKKIEGDVRQS